MDLTQLFRRRIRRPPGRDQAVVPVPGHEVNVVVEDLLPSRRTVRLGDVQAERLKCAPELSRHPVDGSHHRCCVVLG